MFLLPILQTLSYLTLFNQTTIVYTNYQTLAMTYHSDYPQLLYILYAANPNTSNPTAPYSTYFLQTWNTTSQKVTYNYTGLTINCYIACEIQITSSMFLVESASAYQLYYMHSDNITISYNAWKSIKTTQYSNVYLARYCRLKANRFIYTNGSALFFFTPTQSQKILYFPNTLTIMDLRFFETSVYVMVQNGTVYEMSCVQCVFNLTIPSNITLNSTYYFNQMPIFYTGSISFYRMFKGNPQFDVDSRSFYFFVLGTTVYKILQNTTTSSICQTFTANSYPQTVSNSEFIYFYGSNLLLNQTFQNITSASDSSNLIPLNFGNVALMALANDSSIIAMLTDSNSGGIYQYQLVQNCQDYEAVQNGSFCACNNYIGAYCNYASNITNNTNNTNSTNTTNNQLADSTQSFSFPIYAIIITVLGGVALIIVIVKAIYSKCIKSRRKTERIPHKHSPVELISFEF